MFNFKKIVAKILREKADAIELGTSEITETEALDILSVIAHDVMSKEQACIYLQISRSQFDNYVRDGFVPRGKKRAGFRELVWYKDELDVAARRIRKSRNVNNK